MKSMPTRWSTLRADAAFFGLVRFGRWKEIFCRPASAGRPAVLDRDVDHARGLALTATGKLADARRRSPRSGGSRRPFRRPYRRGQSSRRGRTSRSAAAVLAGRRRARGRTDDALAAPGRASSSRTAPAVHGAAGLVSARPASSRRRPARRRRPPCRRRGRLPARTCGRNPDNGWALFGLRAALRGAEEDGGDRRHRRALHRAWRAPTHAGSDVQILARPATLRPRAARRPRSACASLDRRGRSPATRGAGAEHEAAARRGGEPPRHAQWRRAVDLEAAVVPGRSAATWTACSPAPSTSTASFATRTGGSVRECSVTAIAPPLA